MELNPWYGYSLVLDQDLLGGDGYSLVLAGIIGTMIIRAPHGGRSRKIPVVDHRKGKWEILFVSLVSMSMVIPIIAMASTVLAFADFRVGNGREAPGHPGNVEADDISRRETRPISGRRAGDTISKRELDVASVVNETPESMVVTSTSSMSFHASMIRTDVIGASLSPFVRCRSSNESVPQVEPRV